MNEELSLNENQIQAAREAFVFAKSGDPDAEIINLYKYNSDLKYRHPIFKRDYPFGVYRTKFEYHIREAVWIFIKIQEDPPIKFEEPVKIHSLTADAAIKAALWTGLTAYSAYRFLRAEK